MKISEGFYTVRLQQKSHSAHEEGSATATELSSGYLLPFEIASVHLLVVLIGAAYLARAKRRVDPTL